MCHNEEYLLFIDICRGNYTHFNRNQQLLEKISKEQLNYCIGFLGLDGICNDYHDIVSNDKLS